MDAIASSATVSFRKMVDRKSGWSALVKSDYSISKIQTIKNSSI